MSDDKDNSNNTASPILLINGGEGREGEAPQASGSSILTDLKAKHNGREIIIPICIPHINYKNGHHTKAYFFLGGVPASVFNAVKNGTPMNDKRFTEWKQHDKDILKDYYGQSWKKYLTAPDLYLHKLNTNFTIFGGSDNEYEDVSDNVEFTNFKELDFEDEPAEVIEKTIKKSEIKSKFNYNADNTPVYSNLSINSDDTIYTIKLKLQAVSGIQIYRQHMFYYLNEEGPIVPYKITTSDIPIEVNWQHLNTNILMANIGMDLLLMDTKNCMIRANDEFIKFSEVLGIYPNIYFIDMYSVIKPISDTPDENLEDILRDKQQFLLLYYGAIIKFWPMLNIDAAMTALTNPELIGEKYPLLAQNQQDLLHKYAYIDEIKPSETVYPMNVTRATIITTPFGRNRVINLKNVFILLNTDSILLAVKLYLESDIIVREFKRDPHSYTADVRNGIEKLLNYYLNKNTLLLLLKNKGRIITIKISIDGSYVVSASWNEDDFIQFENITKDVSKSIETVIKRINDIGSAAFPLGGNLNEISIHNNTSLGLITCNIYWPKIISNAAFRELKSLFREYEKMGIVETHGIQQLNTYVCNFKYNIIYYNSMYILGMWEKLNNSNQYVYLLDNISFSRWNSVFSGRQIKITHRVIDLKIEVLGANNFQEFEYIKSFILHILENNRSKLLKIQDNRADQNQLRKLQEQDPNLYDLKKYDPNIEVYARICQNERQPRIYLKGEKIDSDAVKYWNFTTNTPAWYRCENKKYPNLGFQTGVHPKSWCLPCCKKSNIENAKDVTNTCVTQHKYVNDDLYSKHVLLYGKYLTDYRIQHCPKELEDGLFLDCIGDEYKFKLIGTIQTSLAIENAGFMYSIAHALSDDEMEIIKDISDYVRDLTDYNTLGNGLGACFESSEELADCILHSFDNSAELTKFSIGGCAEKWELIIMDIIFDLYDMAVVHFIDDGVKIIMNITAKAEKVVCLFTNSTGTYLIGALKPAYYLRALKNERWTISRRWFCKDTDHEVKDNVYDTIYKFIKNKNVFNIYFMLEFCEKNPKYSIKCALLNMHNKCYGVVLLKNDTPIYCPLNNSSYPDVEISYDVRDFTNKHDDILDLISDLKINILKPIVNIVSEREKWQIGYIIGSKDNKLFIYHEKIPYTGIGEDFINMPYDPLVIDELIIDYARKDIEVPEDLELNYINKLYTLFTIEFATIIKNNKNLETRKKLKGLISQFDIQNSVILKDKIIEMDLNYNDMAIIRDIIKECYGNKEKAILIIEETKFEFDNQIIYEIKKNNGLLRPLMEKVCVFIDKEEPVHLNEIVVSCAEKSPFERNYCEGPKLKITRAMFDVYCDLLINDINDPNKHLLLLATSSS
jgi:hypothetical protein